MLASPQLTEKLGPGRRNLSFRRRPLGSIRAISLAGALIAALFLGRGATLSFAAPALKYSEDHPVLAYYYGIRSQDVKMQVSEAQSSGIDGFIVWWDGVGGDRDRQFQQVLDAGRASGFRATIHFHAWDSNLGEELQGFYDKRLSDPNLVTYQGRPVLFFWATWLQSNETWSALRQQVDPDHRALWMADGDNFGEVGGDAWDGISPYAIAWSANPAAQLPAWAAKSRAVSRDKLYVPPVSPGCDDSAVRAATCVQARNDGAYYRATWAGALASNPPWAIVISTFDEWSEQTQIEPGGDYGDLYMQITSEYARAFKGGAPVEDAPPAE
jgi:hypothetical protein